MLCERNPHINKLSIKAGLARKNLSSGGNAALKNELRIAKRGVRVNLQNRLIRRFHASNAHFMII